MKILLIDPCKEPTLTPRKRGVGKFPQAGLLYVAAATPPDTVKNTDPLGYRSNPGTGS